MSTKLPGAFLVLSVAALTASLASASVHPRSGEVAFPGRPAETVQGLVEIDGEVLDAHYQIVDGMAVFEGDVILGTAEEVALRDAELRRDAGRRLHSGVWRSFSWSGNVIPYEIAPGFGAAQRAEILSAIEHWNEKTLVRIRPRAGEADYVRFFPGSGCWSYIGKIGGEQLISIGEGCNRGTVIHEIGHAAGLFHEQSRTDRDAHVRIWWENIIAGYEHAFDMYDPSYGRNVGPYDIGSVMHYPSHGFSRNGQPTITRVDGGPVDVQRDGLSDGDVAGVTALVIGDPARHALENWRNERCMEVRRGSFDRGARIETRPCRNVPQQDWKVARDPHSGKYLLVSLHSFQCLTSPKPGARGRIIKQTPCNGRTRQQMNVWELLPSVWFQNVASSGCVVGSAGKPVRERACVFPLLGDDAQTWAYQRR